MPRPRTIQRLLCWTRTANLWNFYPGWVPLEDLSSLLNIELDDGKIYRKALYLMVKTMVSCRFSLKPIQCLLLHTAKFLLAQKKGYSLVELTKWLLFTYPLKPRKLSTRQCRTRSCKPSASGSTTWCVMPAWRRSRRRQGEVEPLKQSGQAKDVIECHWSHCINCHKLYPIHNL